MYVASFLLLGFAAVPGFPWPLFVILSAALAFAGYRLRGRSKTKDDEGEKVMALQRAGAKGDAPTILKHAPQFTSALGVRLSLDLSARLSPGALDTAFDLQRKRLQEEIGVPFPGITMWCVDTLPANTFEVLVQDVPATRIELPAGKVMVPAAAGDPALAALCQSGPAACGFAETWWIGERQAPPNVPVWQTEQVIAGETVSVLRLRAKLFVGIQETQWVLDQLGQDYPGLVAEVQKALPLQRIADVLRRLLEENVPIRNARAIMESLVNWGPKEKDMLMLAEYVRGDLSRFIAYRATGGAPTIQAVLFDNQLEQHIRQSIKQTPTGNFLALHPDQINDLIDSIASYAGDTPRTDVALVTSMDIRRYVRRMIETRLAWLQVYSYQELSEHVELRPLGRVTI